MTRENIIKITDLCTGYGKDKIVSKKLNLNAPRGEFIVMIGPNGCGKSTLFRTISGLQRPMEGDIFIEGKSIRQIGVKEKASLFALVLTDKIDIDSLTVFDIVSMGRYPYVGMYGNLSAEDKDIVYDAIDSCGISHLKDKEFNHLSDGEKQRVMIGRALAQQTPIILLDEPTAHLDIPNRISIIMMLKHLATDLQKSVITITHDLELALSWSDRVWLMNHKGEVFDGVPEDLVFGNFINDVFQSDKVIFDINNGNFIPNLKYGNRRAVVFSDTYRKNWLVKALCRIGVSLVNDDNYDFAVYDKNDKIIIECNKTKETLVLNNVEELLNHIRQQ